MISIEFYLLVFIFATTVIIAVFGFIHAAIAALLLLVVPEALINHFAHAIMHVHSSA